MISRPETPLATGNVIEDAVASIQQPVATTTTGGAPDAIANPDPSGATSPFTVPGAPGQFAFGMQDPMYAWQPSQADLGQGEVQRFGMATGMVPVAEKKLPFGAIASRQQASAQKREALELAKQKHLEKYDPFGGVGKAADPFQPAFGKYARNTLNTYAQEIADGMYEGDVAEVYKRIAQPGTQERNLWEQKVAELNDLATANRYDFQQIADIYAAVKAGTTTIDDPQILRDMESFLSAMDRDGLPVSGADPSQLRSKREDLMARISLNQYMGEFMKELPKIVHLQAQEIARAKAVRGGKFMIEDLSVRNMEPAIRQHADMYSAMSMGRVSPDQAYEEMRKIFNDEIQRELKIYGPEKPSGDGDGARKTGPQTLFAYGPVEGSGSTKQHHQVRVGQVTSGAGKFLPPSPFVNEAGESMTLHPVSVYRDTDTGFLRIIGKSGADPRASVQKQERPDGGFDFFMFDEEGGSQPIDEATYFKNLPVVNIPYEGANEAAFNLSTGLSRQDIEMALIESEQVRSRRDAEFMSSGRGKSSAAPAAKAPTKGKLY